jgi:hypothetical protein
VTVLWLATLSPARQREELRELLENGKRPKRDRGDKKTLTLPIERQAFARALVRKVGAVRAREYLTVLPTLGLPLLGV